MCGKKRRNIISSKGKQIIPSISIKQVDSTGAGDSFVGSTLYQYTINTLEPTMEQLAEYIPFSNCVGALTCENYGAIAAIPSMEQVKQVLRK